MKKEEMIEQIKVAEFIRQKTDLPFMHIANERKTTGHHGELLRRMGVLPGVADIFIPRRTAIFAGLWIELKVGKNKLLPSQIKFIASMIEEGYAAHVAYGADEAIHIIKSIYHLD